MGLPGRPEQGPEQTERLIRAVEDAYGSRSYRDLGQERDRKQLAVLATLQDAGTRGERHRENGA